MQIAASDRVLAVVGDPVDHSLSPAMYNAAIAALGLRAVYVGLRVEPGALAPVMRAFEALGVSGNVTVPHKIAVARLLIRLTSVAKDVGAVNTFWPERGRLVGDNTDVHAVLVLVEQLDADGPWLVVGTGGAARGVAAAAAARGAPLLVRSRRADRARRFAAWARELGVPSAAADDGSAVAVAINATPVGLRQDDPLPAPSQRLRRCGAVLDLVYRRGGTAWVREGAALGLPALDGREMLLAQGCRAFERFFPDQVAPREVMAAAVERALAP